MPAPKYNILIIFKIETTVDRYNQTLNVQYLPKVVHRIVE